MIYLGAFSNENQFGRGAVVSQSRSHAPPFCCTEERIHAGLGGKRFALYPARGQRREIIDRRKPNRRRSAAAHSDFFTDSLLGGFMHRASRRQKQPDHALLIAKKRSLTASRSTIFLLSAAYSRVSSSAIQRADEASLGICQSPRGDSETEPTLGPSGRQDRLNCWIKKRR